MGIIDYIDLCDDDDVINLTSEDVIEEENDAHEKTNANQEFVKAEDGTEKSMQSGYQGIVAADDGKEEALQQSGNQNRVATCDSAGEVVRTGDQDIVAGGDDTGKAMQSGNQDFIGTSDGAEEATQPGEAAEVASSSSVAEQGATTSSTMTGQSSHETSAFLSFPPMSTESPFPRQFWKAGEYRVAAEATINNGLNLLRVDPKFLHSNATSHKWAFGAIAELLDNAVDEVHNGATFVKVDKIKYSPTCEYSLVVEDDGGGMSSESLRHCMSFGFSKKCTDSSIGQYGNGFKTSTMRLGADVIVFSCRQDNRGLTRSVGLLSYTFLTRTGCTDVLVPLVSYESDAPSCTFKRIMDHGEKHFSSSLSTILRWSPFPTEEGLLNQFGKMGFHGTKIIVFNLWFNDAMEMELDFTTDEQDIMISGASEMSEERRKVQRLKYMHVANRFRYSLRVYASILYIRLPENFQIILCGQVVEPHSIASDLKYRRCIKYRPQVEASREVDVYTIIGFLEDAPNLDIHGFNIYHKNRLILPFWSANCDYKKRRGIAGILEANFIRPAHDKQDFEKTELFRRLEERLRQMTMEYWRKHCHLVGYTRLTKTPTPAHYTSVDANKDDSLAARAATKTYVGNLRDKASVGLDPCSSGGNSLDPLHVERMDYGACSSRRNMRTSSCIPGNPPQKSQTEPFKRRNSCSVIEWKAQKRKNNNDYASHSASINTVEMGEERSSFLISENSILKSQCSELEAACKQLSYKEDKLRSELREWQRVMKGLADQLKLSTLAPAHRPQHDLLHGNTTNLGLH